MAEEKMERARKVYETLCSTMKANGWHSKNDDEKLSISCTAQGEDLPMDVTIKIDADRQLIMLLSHLPFVIAEDKRLDVAVATSVINNKLVYGCFDYDIANGRMFFRMTSSFIESEISGELLNVMLMSSFRIIDDFNDKFLMLSKGMISIEKCVADNQN